MQARESLFQALYRHTPSKSLNGHTGGITAAAFSPDGQSVVTASADRTARIHQCGVGCGSFEEVKSIARRRLERQLRTLGHSSFETLSDSSKYLGLGPHGCT